MMFRKACSIDKCCKKWDEEVVFKKATARFIQESDITEIIKNMRVMKYALIRQGFINDKIIDEALSRGKSIIRKDAEIESSGSTDGQVIAKGISRKFTISGINPFVKS